ncbi:MAG TPA: hypothetical protein PKZ16_02950 [bacterium]|nr:hypothetical protein [bacterium]HPL95171.1 hypothetical protein [bacterium]
MFRILWSLINLNARKIFSLTLFCASVFVFIVLLFSNYVQAASTEVYGVMTTDQVWDKAHSPYVISWRGNGLIIQAKLTILPGTVIKIYANRNWNEYFGLKIDGANGGQLIAEGTIEEPIIFTSWYDDEIMGDTNNDATWYQAPQSGDYRALNFYQTNNSHLENVIIKYGGTARNNNSTILVDNSIINFNNLKLIKNLQPGIVLKNNSQATIENLEAVENKNEILQLYDASKAIFDNSLVHNNFGNSVIKISAAADLSGTNNSFIDNSNQKIIISPYDINQTVTWRKFDLPYYLEGQIKITPTGQLNINAGVEAHFGYYYSRLFNLGELNIMGAAAAPVVFTSFSNNASINNDFWGGVVFEAGSRGQINYLTIKDAGTYAADWTGSTYLTNEYNALRITSAHPEFNHLTIDSSKINGLNITDSSAPVINHCDIKNNLQWGAISNSSALVTFNKCSFINNTAGALRNDSQVVVDARDSWWGSETGPKTGIHSQGQGSQIQGLVVYEPWQGKENLPFSDLEPVIVIPGITGSWQKYIVAGEWRLDPFFHTYDNLLAALRQIGYQDDVNLFPFPYQWRQDNNLTAIDLKNKIQTVKNITGKNKVDLIAHSMGGLIARAYIQSADYMNDVDQLIFLGTPQTGSVNAYVPWMSGLNLVKGKSDIFPRLTNKIFQIEADYYGYNDLFNYVQDKIKSVAQLLPIFDYLIDNETNILRIYPDNYPANTFLENLNQAANVLKLKQRVQMTNVVSKTTITNTVEFLKVMPYLGADGKWPYGYPNNYDNASGDHGLIMGEGDETVPLKSAADLDIYPFIQSDAKHVNLPTTNQNDVIYALTGKQPTTIVEQNNFNGSSVIKAFLLFTLHSPIDIEIIDPSGNKIGKDFNNNLEINNIPGGFYSGFDGPTEFIFIPNPLAGEYKINLQGTADGAYGVEINYNNENQEKNIIFESTIRAGELINLTSNLEPANLDNWQIKTSVDINQIINLAENIWYKYLWAKKIVLVSLQSIKKDYEILSTAIKYDRIKLSIRLKIAALKLVLKTYQNQGLIKITDYQILINNLNYLLSKL